MVNYIYKQLINKAKRFVYVFKNYDEEQYG